MNKMRISLCGLVLAGLFGSGQMLYAASSWLEDGLVYRLDASEASTIVTNSSGAVIRWTAVNNDGILFTGEEGSCPYYDATALGGHGGILFGMAADRETYQSSRLATAFAASYRTVFIVHMPIATQNAWAGIWGNAGEDLGIRNNGTDGSSTVHWDGTNMGDGQYNASLSEATCAAGTLQCLRVAKSADMTAAATAVGNYLTTSGASARTYRGYIAEVLVYKGEKSDEDSSRIITYLRNKWSRMFWTGASGATDWTDAKNWKPAISPAASNDVFFSDVVIGFTNKVVTCKSIALENASLTFSGVTNWAVWDGVVTAPGYSASTSEWINVCEENVTLPLELKGGVSVVKRGAGALRLTKKQSYSRETRIEKGNLELDGALPLDIGGLVCQLDSSRVDTITEDATSGISEWRSCIGTGLTFTAEGTIARPYYDASAFGGRGGVRLGYGTDGTTVVSPVRLVASRAMTVSTIFIVNKADSAQADWAGLLGVYNLDCGLRIYNKNGQAKFDIGTGLFTWEESVLSAFTTITGTQDYLVAQGAVSSRKLVFGNYAYGAVAGGEARTFCGTVAEILIYDRKLSNPQMARVVMYLKQKWGRTEGFSPDNVAGLVYHLDASDVTSLTTNSIGEIEAWAAKDSSGILFTGKADTLPEYDATAFGGIGGVKFGMGGDGAYKNTRLTASSAVPYRTIFISHSADESQNAYGGLWGTDGSDAGIRVGSASDPFTWTASNLGDSYDSSQWNATTFVAGRTQGLCAMYSGGSCASAVTCLGNYLNAEELASRCYRGTVGEVIAYGGEMTLGQLVDIELYLRDKWHTRNEDCILPETTALAMEPGTGLNLFGGQQIVDSFVGAGTITNGSFIVAGDARLTGDTELPATAIGKTLILDARHGRRLPLLTVRGDMDISEVALSIVNGESIAEYQAVVRCVDGVLTGGPFKSVTLPKGHLDYLADEIILKVNGSFISIR